MSENKGALITPELTALVHWTNGRCASATPQEAVRLGGELLERIQQELDVKYRAGVAAVRRTQVDGGGSYALSEAPQKLHTVVNGGQGYQDGAIV